MLQGACRMHRATVGMALLASVAGCSSYTSPEVAPPADIHPPLAAQLEAPGTGGIRGTRVDPGYVTALARYVVELHRLRGAEITRARMGIGRALPKLARVLEQIPGTRRELYLAPYAQQIRQEDARAVLGANLEGESEASVLRALQAASAALLRVAEGPYRRAPEVGERARALRDRVQRLASAATEPLGATRDDQLAALEQAERVFLAIHTAAAEGQVR